VYNNWDDIVGVTFLSLDDSFYQLLPYEAISEEQYNKMVEETPMFNPNTLKQFENFEEEFEIEEILDEEEKRNRITGIETGCENKRC